MALSRSSKRQRRDTVAKRRIASVTKRVLRQQLEKKYFNTDLYSGTAPDSWTFRSAIAGLQQGSTATTRIGDKIRIHKIEFMVSIEPLPVANTESGSRCRVILYHNKQANGAVPTAANGVFDSDEILSLRYHPKLPQYTVLKDYVHNMSIMSAAFDSGTSTTLPLTAGPPIQFKWVIYPKTPIAFTSSAGTISDILRDDYGLGFVGDESDCCNIEVITKVTFTDA